MNCFILVWSHGEDKYCILYCILNCRLKNDGLYHFLPFLRLPFCTVYFGSGFIISLCIWQTCGTDFSIIFYALRFRPLEGFIGMATPVPVWTDTFGKHRYQEYKRQKSTLKKSRKAKSDVNLIHTQWKMLEVKFWSELELRRNTLLQ